MPGYVEAALHKFQHPHPPRPENSPFQHNVPQYGVKVQMTLAHDDSPKLPPQEVKVIQQIIGTFLYYARAMLVALSSLASLQSQATEETAAAVIKFLNYAHTNPSAVLRYRKSNASYLSECQARSRIGGHFFLGNKPTAPDTSNDAILVLTGILEVVAASAAEAEIVGLFSNAKEGAILRTILQEMGHTQQATPIQTDNSTAAGIANEKIKQQRSQAIDM